GCPRSGIAYASVDRRRQSQWQPLRLQENPSTTNLPSKKKSGDEPTKSTCSEVVSRGQSSTTGCVPRPRYCSVETEPSTKRPRSLFQPVMRRLINSEESSLLRRHQSHGYRSQP